MSRSPEVENPEVAHEDSDVNVRAILGFGAALTVVAIVLHVFLWWLQGVYHRQTERQQMRQYPMAVDRQNALPPMPRLQPNPQQEMRDLRARQETLLKGYGWVNKEAGIARIPIEDAMRMVVERGLPTREKVK
jgi:hypothetical protein